MLILTIITLLLQFHSSNCEVPDSNNILLAEKVLAIERLMLTPGTIDFQVSTCAFALNVPLPGPVSNCPDQPGDQTAAQWVRTIFHDFITANVSAGTGGLDASVGFESSRAENFGNVFPGQNFIDRTIIGFNLFSTVFISTSDFIALGLAEAVLSCDPNSPMIKLRAGRIDATQAGPTGVPGPTDGIVSQTAAFARAGFSKTEMIQAVACGHSIGGVHKVNFDAIVGNQPTFGSSEVDYFDDTPFSFDNTGVKNYISGKGKAGGPLVTTADTVAASDLGIFKSDGNATIKAMATSQQTFENACFPIFEKMLNTVPATNGPLSDVIGPRKFITMWSFLDFNSANQVTYSGTIATYGKTAAPSTASYQYGTIGGGNTGPKTSSAGVIQTNIINNLSSTDQTTGVTCTFVATKFPYFGTVTHYNFSDIIFTPTTNSLSVAGVFTEPINLNIFVVPSMSFVNPTGAPGGAKYLVRAALLTTLSPPGTTLTATLYYAAGQAGTTSPKYKQFQAPLTSFTTKGAYTVFQGTILTPTEPIGSNGGGGSHIDVSLGTTQRSVKAQALAAPGKNLFTICGNDDLSTC